MRTPYTNTEDHAVYVGGQLIPAGETRQVELHTAVDAPAADAPVDPQAALKQLLEGKVGEIVPALPGLSDEDLDAALALENAGAKPRKTLVEALELARLERIDLGKVEGEDDSEDEAAENGTADTTDTAQG